MIKYLQIFHLKIDGFLSTKKRLLKILTFFFDFGSKVTHFFLFNRFMYIITMLLILIVPIAFSVEMMEFLLQIKNISSFCLGFYKLPLPLQIVIIYFFFINELVIFCTILALLPCIKKEMISKYNDSLIMKKRGYNTPVNSLRRSATYAIPAAAAVISASDYGSHIASVNAVLAHNRGILELYKINKDKKLLDKLQKIPTATGFSEKMYKASAKFRDFLVSWGKNSTTKD